MNKKFWQLDDIAWLKEQTQVKTMAEIAKEVGCHRGSVEFAITRHLSEEEQANIKRRGGKPYKKARYNFK